MLKLDEADSRPPYQQVASVLRAAITSGEYAPGGKLPSGSAIATEYGVAAGTVRSALDLLRSEGLIVTRQGQGTFVRSGLDSGGEDDPPITRSEAAGIRRALNVLTQRLDALERRIPIE